MRQTDSARCAYTHDVTETRASPGPSLEWLPDELRNLLYLAERSGLQSTARDLRFAVRSTEVELRQKSAPKQLD